MDKQKFFINKNNCKISVIITIYNGEAYLKTALLSIQNQDFKDIEIIMIDDGSVDKSVNLIKELMLKEPRIVLYQNNENKGMLYTKTKGILLAKGKYILLLDEDDIFVQRDAFSTLYKESEKHNLDILEFKSMVSKKKLNIKKTNVIKKNESPIIFQPKISELMFHHNQKGDVLFANGLLTNRFIKKNILIKAINQINKKYLNEKMNFHDDYLLCFLITRIAYNYKKIKRIFYIVLSDWNVTDKKTQLRIKEKFKNRKYIRCNSLLNFIEFVLYKTNNTFYDKKIAFYSLDRWFLSYWCRNYGETLKKAINISKLFLNCEYIRDDDKRKIKIFLNEANNN